MIKINRHFAQILFLLAGVTCLLSEDAPITAHPEINAGITFGIDSPKPIRVKLHNSSSSDVTASLRAPKGLSIFSRLSGVAANKRSADSSQSLDARVIIKAGSSHLVTIYLDNHLEFPEAGDIQLGLSLEIGYISNESTKITPTGEVQEQSFIIAENLSVSLGIKEKFETEQEFFGLITIVGSGASREIRQEAVKALCSVRHASVVPYLGQMINTNEGAWAALQCLTGIWFDYQPAKKLIEDYLETSSDPRGLRILITSYLERGRLISPKTQGRLFASENPDIRYLGIWYTLTIAQSLQLDLALRKRPNENSANLKLVQDLAIYLDAMTKGINLEDRKLIEAQNQNAKPGF